MPVEISEKAARGFREYLKEYTILALVVAVITLFKMYYNLNDFVIHTIMEDHNKMEIVIEKNTEVIQLLKH